MDCWFLPTIQINFNFLIKMTRMPSFVCVHISSPKTTAIKLFVFSSLCVRTLQSLKINIVFTPMTTHASPCLDPNQPWILILPRRHLQSLLLALSLTLLWPQTHAYCPHWSRRSTRLLHDPSLVPCNLWPSMFLGFFFIFRDRGVQMQRGEEVRVRMR